MKQLALVLPPPTAPRSGALRSFHARSHVPVAEALAGEDHAQRQEDILLQWFQAHPVARVTPSELARSFAQWPITSIRRALTNLTTAGALRHDPRDRRPGPYGVNESTWGLA